MDSLSLIRKPIESELCRFIEIFEESLSHNNGLLQQALNHIKNRGGKRMRPILILLIAKNFGKVTLTTQNAAVGLELLHTASLVHDDVVDESGERRGQASVNAAYDNKAAVLVGDFILSTALLYVSYTKSDTIVRMLAQLGRTLSDGEILQLTNISNRNIEESTYYEIINRKTAALFAACAEIGAESAGANSEIVEAARNFGHNLGIMFQIRDDIFDYYDSESETGKPAGNDMLEGKLTLPAIFAIKSEQNELMNNIASKVKNNTVSAKEIDQLVTFTKEKGGIEYARNQMYLYHKRAMEFIEKYAQKGPIGDSLKAYLDFIIDRRN